MGISKPATACETGPLPDFTASKRWDARSEGPTGNPKLGDPRPMFLVLRAVVGVQ
jgi:hypothetical protein